MAGAACCIFLIAQPFVSVSVFTGMVFVVLGWMILVRGFILPPGMLRWAALPVLLVCVGMLHVGGHGGRDIVRDSYNMLFPLAMFWMAFLYARGSAELEPMFRGILLAAAALAFVYAGNALIHWQAIRDADIQTIRGTLGNGYMLPTICIPLLLTAHHHGVRLFGRATNTALLILFAMALCLSFSREMVVMVLVGIGVALGLFTRKRLVWGVVFFCLAMSAVYYLRAQDLQRGSFFWKIANIPDELVSSEFSSMADVNDKWRAYETFRAVDTFITATPFEKLTGLGLGALLDLRLYMKLGDEKFRFIPITHNGYAYVILKCGLIGLVLYLCFLVTILRRGLRSLEKSAAALKFLGSLLILSSVNLAIVTLVTTGWFQWQGCAPVILLLGLVEGYRTSVSQVEDKSRHSQQVHGKPSLAVVPCAL